MSATEEIHIGDTVTLRFTFQDQGTAIDLSGATTLQATLEAPDATTSTETLTMVGDGSTGEADLVATTGTFDAAGIWKAQGVLVDSLGSWKSDIHRFEVFSNL